MEQEHVYTVVVNYQICEIADRNREISNPVRNSSANGKLNVAAHELITQQLRVNVHGNDTFATGRPYAILKDRGRL